MLAKANLSFSPNILDVDGPVRNMYHFTQVFGLQSYIYVSLYKAVLVKEADSSD
jgi:hypothetical protein